jgi:hypothetical protein
LFVFLPCWLVGFWIFKFQIKHYYDLRMYVMVLKVSVWHRSTSSYSYLVVLSIGDELFQLSPFMLDVIEKFATTGNLWGEYALISCSFEIKEKKKKYM